MVEEPPNNLFEIATNISTPLALSGLFAVIFFYTIKWLLSKDTLAKLVNKSTHKIIGSVIQKLFILSLAAMILGFAGYIYTITVTEDIKVNGGSIELTVYVHGPAGKQDIVIENDGKIIADIGGDRRRVTIGENGRTNLGEIPLKFRNDSIPLSVAASGFEIVEPDMKYKLDGAPVYLAIKRIETLYTIEGLVRNFDDKAPLQDVVVQYKNYTDTTNDKGWFSIPLPAELEADHYSITISKKGFKTETSDYYPNAGPFEARMKKKSSK